MVELSNIGVLLQTALSGGPTGSHSQSTPRVPMYFTSTLRLRTANSAPPIDFRSSLVGGATRNFFVEPQLPFSYAPYEGLTSTILQSVIGMQVNPKSIKWQQNKRTVKKDTREGSTFFHFTDNQGRNNDILTMEFSGNTGTLDLRGSINSRTGALDPQGRPKNDPAGQDTGALAKLLTWHNLYALTREPMLLPDNTQNQFTIVYQSKTFPIQLELTGFFSRVLDFEENASKPNSLDYTFGFTVQSTEPPMDNLLQSFGEMLTAPTNVNDFVDSGQELGTEIRNLRRANALATTVERPPEPPSPFNYGQGPREQGL